MINHLKVKRKSIEIYKWQVLKFKIFQKVAYCMTYLTFIKKKKNPNYKIRFRPQYLIYIKIFN